MKAGATVFHDMSGVGGGVGGQTSGGLFGGSGGAGPAGHTAVYLPEVAQAAASSDSAPAILSGVKPYVKEETEDEDIHMAFDEAATQVAGTEEEEARDRQKCQLRFTLNEYCTTMSDKDVLLTRCYWDQSALLQSEWDQSLLGNMRGFPGKERPHSPR